MKKIFLLLFELFCIFQPFYWKHIFPLQSDKHYVTYFQQHMHILSVCSIQTGSWKHTHTFRQNLTLAILYTWSNFCPSTSNFLFNSSPFPWNILQLPSSTKTSLFHGLFWYLCIKSCSWLPLFILHHLHKSLISQLDC